MKKERFIAFFDILGFKNLVTGLKMDIIIERMNELVDIINLSIKNPIRGKNDELPSDEKLLNYIQFSDSVVFYTEGLSANEFSRLLYVSKVFIYFSLLRGLPMRGCISHGEFYVNNNIFFGKTLIDAYENGESQNWAGAYVLDNTIQYVRELYPDTFKFCTEKGFLLKYKVPFKLRDNDEKYVINWANYRFIQKELKIKYEGRIAAGFMLKDIINSHDNSKIKETNKHGMVSLDYSRYPQDVRDKINNTIDFFNIAKDINIADFIKFNNQREVQ